MPNLSTLALSDNIIQKTLQHRNLGSWVYDTSGKFNALSKIIDILNAGQSKRFDEVKFERTTMGNLNISTAIQSNTLVGTYLEVNMVDGSYDLFRVGDVVMDSNKIQGRVKSKVPGQVVLEPIGTPFVSATHFINGHFCKVLFDASKDRYSGGKTSIYNVPDLQYNWSSVTRDTNQLARRDYISTEIKTHNNYWWASQELQMLRRVARNLEKKFIYSERAQITHSDGKVSYNGGLNWSIKNRGGIYYKSATELTMPLLNDLIRQTVSKDATRGRNLIMLLGSVQQFNIHENFTYEFIKSAGIDNTFGAKEGLNSTKYAIGGHFLTFVPLNILNDPVFFPELSSITGKPREGSSFYLLDVTPFPSMDGDMGTLPVFERFHFGERELHYGYIPGVIGPDGGKPSDYMKSNSVLQTSDIDGYSSHVVVDNGINIVSAMNMLHFELAS